jgi:hypothetical protein
MSQVEGFVLNSTSGNSAPVSNSAVVTGGKRKKLKMVTRKQARKILKKLGRKMRGGAPNEVVASATPDATKTLGGGMDTPMEETEGGRRHRRGHTKKTKRHSRRHRRGLFY